MTQEQLNEQLKDYCDKYSSFRYNDFHFPAGWNEEQMDVYRESKMEEYLSGIKELIQSEERLAVLEEVEREVENVHSKYFDGIASISEYQKGYLQAQIHISAMLNNLRVK